jgi:anaerobic dimethyl sulfoxide reductase subunit B (iron-sulfur subunit)
MRQLGFYFDQTRCIGCYTCVIACQDWHNELTEDVAWRRVLTLEKGKFPDVYVSFVSVSCHHCVKPTCVEACPAGAIYKTESGIVLVDSAACLGRDSCSMCLEACPYDIPRFGAGKGAKMQKCDLCHDRWEVHRKPICVESCPMYALDAGYMDELRAKYGEFGEVEGFSYLASNEPSIVIKPKRKEG